MKTDYCVVCGGELHPKTKLTEYGSMALGTYYCTECGLQYEFIPPEHLQKRPTQVQKSEITWEGKSN